jgi:CrcB protein
MVNLLWIGLGGALGAMSRYKVTTWIESFIPSIMPYGTLTVNVFGSFFLGLVIGFVQTGNLQEPMRLAIATGFLGALTTFSTFSMETVELFKTGLFLQAFINVFLNVSLSVSAAALAYWVSYSLLKG